MKKILALVLALCMVLTMVACGQKDTTTTPDSTGDSSTSAAAATKFTVCGTNGVGDTQSTASENFAKYLNDLGGWDAVAMVSSEMGSTDDVLEQAMAGAAVSIVSDPARIASYVPGIGILMMPYMFDSYDQLDSLLDTELYQQWCADLRDQGLVLLTNNCITGFRSYVTNNAVNTPSDLNGLKIRTMGSAIAVNSINAMGAIATALNQSEAYNGIETGVVDGGEWQIPTIYSLRLYEVCDHISLTKHFLLTGSVVTGTAWFDTLSEEQQTQLLETAIKAYGETKQLVLEKEDEYLAEMAANGVTIVENPDIDAFKAATADLYSDPDTTGGVDYLALRDELYAQMGIA